MLPEAKRFAGCWDFDGEYLTDSRWAKSISVGVFQWLPKASGKGLKRGPVYYRIRRASLLKAEIVRDATAICNKWNTRDNGAPVHA